MADPDARAGHTSVWDALAHPARRRIVEILRGAPAPTGRIHEILEDEELSTSRFATLRHLQQMREANLVLATRSGRERINALNGSALYEATIGWLSPPDRSLATSLHRLRLTAEENTVSLTTMHVTQSIVIAASREAVWRAFREHPSQWWGAPYTLLDQPGSAIEMPVEIGAPIVEHSGSHRAAWGILTEIDHERTYAWTGNMGMGGPSWGTVSYVFADEGEGTRITVDHSQMGEIPDGVAAGYDAGWLDLNERLRLFVEEGEAFGLAGTNTAPPSIG